MLKRLNDLFPNSEYVLISRYDESAWEGKKYDSRYDKKQPLTQWRTNPLSFEKALQYAERGNRIGWIVPNGYAVVDIDNEDHPSSSIFVKKILDEKGYSYSYNMSSRGIHLLFRDSYLSVNTDAVTKCAIGVTVDHRANHKGYIILPTNDPHREWGDWLDHIDDIPTWLKPLMPAKNQIDSFIGMSDGDGRNTELYKWRTKLLRCNRISDADITEALNLINEYLFATPMSEQEMLDSVTKPRKTDMEQREHGEKVKLNVLEKENIYNTVANAMVEQNDIMCVGYKQYYIFDKTHYKPLREIDIERMIHYDVSQNIPAEGRKEIMRFLAVKTLVEPEEIDKVWHKIAVGNGVLDVVTGELSEPNKDEKNTIAIPWNYNGSDEIPYSPAIDEFMNHISAYPDGSVNIMKKQFLYQIAGYCLLKKNYFGKFFIFQGDGQTGKSTFQDLIVKMIGEQNRSRVGIDKMDADYFLATILGKLINIDDDAVDGKMLENTGRFKSLVTGNEITVRQIFQEPVTFVPFATCMFSCNKLPRIMDKTSGLYRRMVIIELNNKITKPDPLFLAKLTTRDMEYFLHNAVYWVGVALREGKFKISQSEKELLRRFRCRQSSLNEWIYEENLSLEDIYNKGCSALYALYIEWVMMNGYKNHPTQMTFKEDICALYEVEISGDRASKQIFTRRVAPNEQEMKFRPFS